MSSLTAYRWMERLMGSPRFILLYVLSALGGSLCAVVFGRPYAMMAGASGALFGLMGAAAFFAFRGPLPADIRTNLRQRLRSVLLVNGAISLLPFISLSAHAGGFVTGLALGFTGLLSRDLRSGAAPASPARERAIAVGAGLAALVTAASIVAALAMGGGRPPSF